MKVVNSLTYDHAKVKGEVFTKPSLTIPDQTMSLREILDRYSRGLPVDGMAGEPIYHGEEDEMPDFRRMDLAEIQEYRENIQQFVNDTKDKYQAEQADIKSKKAAAAAEQKSLWNQFKDWQKSQSSSSNAPANE